MGPDEDRERGVVRLGSAIERAMCAALENPRPDAEQKKRPPLFRGEVHSAKDTVSLWLQPTVSANC